jgi:protein-disulfide isomerase
MYPTFRFLTTLALALGWTWGTIAHAADKPSVAPASTTSAQGPTATNAVLTVGPDEKVAGSPQAPVTVIEYASLTCVHCAHFAHATLPALQKEYVDTGKVRFVYRDFPLDNQALRAAVLARCAGGERYFPLIEAFFEAQDSWAGKSTYANTLSTIARLAGVSSDTITRCAQDKRTEDAVLHMRLEATDILGVKSTPTFFINGTEASGALDMDKLRGLLNAALAKAKP